MDKFDSEPRELESARYLAQILSPDFICSRVGQAEAEEHIANLFKGQVVDLTAPLAMSAALLSVEHRIPLADSIILAVAREYSATLWTQDEHFKVLAFVQYKGN